MTNGEVFEKMFPNIHRFGTVLVDGNENIIATNINITWWHMDCDVIDVLQMRPATPEEKESTVNAIKKMSKSTGLTFDGILANTDKTNKDVEIPQMMCGEY